jgi:hypothetical protein
MRLAASMLVVACVLIAADDPVPAKKDAQASYEPRSAPGVGQKFLEKMVGEWEVTKSFYPRTGEPARVKGECHQAMIHSGRFLQSDFVFGQGDSKTTGMGVIGFEPDSGRFTSFWTDSRQAGMSLRQSRDKFDGEQIVLFSRSLDPDGKESRKSRTVTRLEDNGHKIVHRQFAISPDGAERLMMDLEMTKKGKASATATN